MEVPEGGDSFKEVGWEEEQMDQWPRLNRTHVPTLPGLLEPAELATI